MNFPRISHRSIAGRLLRLPLRLIPPETTMRILQGRLKGNRWIIGSSTHRCWLGCYEYEKSRLFEKMVAGGSVVFDIGAQAGFYSLLASVLVGPAGRIFAFEPVPANVFFIKQHLRLNRIENVKIIQAAVTDFSGVTSFDDGSPRFMGPHRLLGHISTTGTLRVQTVSLDELISKGELPTPNCIKIDVEGRETEVLRGARSLLVNSHPVLFLATHGPDIHSKCWHLLKSLGYRLEVIRGSSDNTEVLAC